MAVPWGCWRVGGRVVNCVAPCFFGHGGVERGVEDGNLRQEGPHCIARMPERALRVIFNGASERGLDLFGQLPRWVNFSLHPAPRDDRLPALAAVQDELQASRT